MRTNYPLASNIFSAKRQHTEFCATAVIASLEIACNMRKISQLGDLQLWLGRAERLETCLQMGELPPAVVHDDELTQERYRVLKVR